MFAEPKHNECQGSAVLIVLPCYVFTVQLGRNAEINYSNDNFYGGNMVAVMRI